MKAHIENKIFSYYIKLFHNSNKYVFLFCKFKKHVISDLIID